MNTNTMNTIDTDRDRMPPEVATEMLTDPKVKLTGKMRRACLRARETVYPSIRTIVRGKDGFEYVDERDPVNRVVVKAQEANFKQLAQRLRRLGRHRRTAQARWQTVKSALDNFSGDPKKCKALVGLLAHYERLVTLTIDPQTEIVESEIGRRRKGV